MASERRASTKEITFRLSNDEVIEKATKAADLRIARAAIQEEFARVKSTFKGRIEEKENELSTILATIKERKEKRVVDVTEIFDFDEQIVTTTHNGEEVDSRMMTADERSAAFLKKQMPLPLGEESKPSPSPTTVGAADPIEIELDMPERAGQECYVPGDDVRPTKVRHLAVTWLQEPGEAANYVVGEEEVFGTPALVWRRAGSTKLSTPEETNEQPADEPKGKK